MNPKQIDNNLNYLYLLIGFSGAGSLVSNNPFLLSSKLSQSLIPFIIEVFNPNSNHLIPI